MSTTSIITCCRVAEAPDPIDGSIAVNCYRCGAAVWLDPLVYRNLAGDDIEIFCQACTPPGNPTGITAAQIAALRADGMDVIDIAHTLAWCTLTNGDTDVLQTLMAEVEADPRGPTAGRYRDALIDAFVVVAEAR